MTKKTLVARAALWLIGMLFVPVAMMAQVTVSGIVTDGSGEPVIGASVLEKGTANGTVTDFDGKFAVNVANANATLVVSYVGLETQEVALRGRKVVNVTLKTNEEVLDEVVVVGYGTMKKSDLSGATVSMKESDLRQSISTSLDQTLQGKAAGVTAVTTSGAPGSSSSIRVRGQATVNANAEPLYVIDGVVVQGGGNSGADFGLGDALGNGKVSTISPLSTINPSDIVSMEILKDASATAIYGAQGANGVVLITTKHGQEGKAKITYDGMVAWSQQTKRLDMMNLRQFATFYNECEREGANLSSATPSTSNYADPSILGVGTDWQSAIFRTGLQHSHQLAVQGGTDKVKYYVSGNYMNQEGTIIGTKFNRFSVRANLDAQLNKWLKLGFNASYSMTNDELRKADSNEGIIYYSLLTLPDIPIYDIDGNYASSIREGYTSPNPVAKALANEINLRRQKLMGNIYLDINPIKGLNWRSEFGYDLGNNKSEMWEPTLQFGAWVQNVNKSSIQTNNNFYWQVKNYLTYSNTINDHSFSVMAGQECWESKWEYIRVNGSDLPSNDIHNPSLGDKTNASIGSGFGRASMASFFARGTYNYADRYYLTYTFRYDGSSNFGPKNRWAPFHSVAGSWRFSNEKFFEPLQPVWSNGKLRFGWGQTGNANIGGYAWGVAMSGMDSFLGAGFRPGGIANEYVHWEKQEQFNLGLDLGFWDDKLSFVLDLYQKTSKDMLMPLTLPSYMGTQGNGSSALAAPKGNYGSIQNRGLEFAINVNPFKGKKVEWESNLQFSFNQNKLLSLEGTGSANLPGYGQWSDVVCMSQVGQPLYGFWGYEVEGVYKDYEDLVNSPKTIQHPADGVSFNRNNTVWVGDIKFKDVDGNGVIDENDKTIIGSPMPKFTFGWTNTLRFFGVDLSVFLNGSYGNQVLNYNSITLSSTSTLYRNQLNSVSNRAHLYPIDENKVYPCTVNGVEVTRWQDDVTNTKVSNPETKTPRAATSAMASYNTQISSRYVEDASYLRIKNIVLGYTLPRKALKAMHFDNFRIYLNIQNLATFTKYTGYDPEVGASTQDATGLAYGVDNGRYPSPTTYSLGLNIGF